VKTIRRFGTVLIGSAVALASPILGQEGPSILTLLDVEERRLEIESEASGLLTGLDVQTTGGRRVQAWGLELTGTQSVTIDLRSETFDPYLYVTGPGISGTLDDDDGAGGCDARLTLRAGYAGFFRVVVSSIGGNTGPYTLRVTTTPGPASSGNCESAGGDLDPTLDDRTVEEMRFDELPIDGRRLTIGDEQVGMLTAADTADGSGSHVQVWGLALEAGQPVAIDLVSDDFDALLYLTGPGLETPISDDDGAGGCHARIFYSAQATGEHRVAVTTVAESATGSFTLRVADRPGPVVNEPCGGGMEDFSALPFDGRSVGRGMPATGRLSGGDRTSRDGRPVQAWALEASAGETLTVTLRSEDFDPFLRLTGPQLVPLSDDDGAGGCSARITFTAPQAGTYHVVVTSAFASGLGSFVLEVTDAPTPPSNDPCA